MDCSLVNFSDYNQRSIDWGNLIIPNDQLWNLNRFPPLTKYEEHTLYFKWKSASKTHTTHVSITFNCTNLSDIPFGIERLVQIFHIQQDGQFTIGKECFFVSFYSMVYIINPRSYTITLSPPQSGACCTIHVWSTSIHVNAALWIFILLAVSVCLCFVI